MRSHIEVFVPATSANLGPGYDSFGLALDLGDDITAIVRDEPVDLADCVEVRGEGAGSLPSDDSHLVHRVARTVLEERGLNYADHLQLKCVNSIPQSRGMGSSAAAVVAGISIADAITVQAGLPGPSPAEKLEWAVHFEGHPDNAAPALFGGVSVSFVSAEGEAVSASLPVHPAVRVVLVIPETKLDTSVARNLIPETVPHAQAAANSARAGLFVHAIGHDPSYLFEATKDFLHQEYRRPAMPESLARVDALRAAGLAAIVSGAGPVVAVLGTDLDLERKVAQAIDTAEVRIVSAAIADAGAVTTVTPQG